MQPQTAWFGEKLTPLVTGFLLSKVAEGWSPCTLMDYRTALLHYGRWLEANGKDPLKATVQNIRTLVSWLRVQTSRRGKPLSPKSALNCQYRAPQLLPLGTR